MTSITTGATQPIGMFGAEATAGEIARAAARTDDTTDDGPRGPSTRVLIVDDNPDIHDDFGKILARHQGDPSLDALTLEVLGKPNDHRAQNIDFVLDSAYGGQEALAMVRRSIESGHPYCLVFLDVRMPPGWDGLETLLQLWEIDPRLEVVLCTAYSDYSWSEIFERVGNRDQLLILKKPFEVPEVRQLAYGLAKKWSLARANERRLAQLEQRVAARTAQLEAANEQLRQEMAERSRAEERLRRAQRLETLGRLAASVGHEINNPLSFVVAGAEAALEELAEVSAETSPRGIDEARRHLEMVLMGSDRIREIVKTIKLFARPSRNVLEPVDVTQAIRYALDVVSHAAREDMEIVRDFGDVSPVAARRVELEQVLVNLLHNAIQALADVRDRPVRLRVTSRAGEDGRVVVEIADTGVGIPDDDLDKILEPFFTTKPVGKGTGLGLFICHSMVTGFGGTLDVSSKVGEGTVVTLSLHGRPRRDEPAEAQSAEPGADPEPQAELTGRILVVDDEPLIRKILARGLRGHEVVEAASGREALARCESGPFDVILCDLMMPDLDGPGLYAEFQRTYPGAEADIVFLTGGVETEAMARFLERVPNPCLEKPITREQLRRVVREGIRRKRQG